MRHFCYKTARVREVQHQIQRGLCQSIEAVFVKHHLWWLECFSYGGVGLVMVLSGSMISGQKMLYKDQFKASHGKNLILTHFLWKQVTTDSHTWHEVTTNWTVAHKNTNLDHTLYIADSHLSSWSTYCPTVFFPVLSLLLQLRKSASWAAVSGPGKTFKYAGQSLGVSALHGVTQTVQAHGALIWFWLLDAGSILSTRGLYFGVLFQSLGNAECSRRNSLQISPGKLNHKPISVMCSQQVSVPEYLFEEFEKGSFLIPFVFICTMTGVFPHELKYMTKGCWGRE